MFTPKIRINPFVGSLALITLLTCGALLAADEKTRESADPISVPVSREESPEERRVRMLKNYEEVLKDLTPGQKTKLLAVLEPTSDAIRAVRKDGTLSNEEYRKRVLKLHADAAEKVDAILTDSQRAKWQKSREEKRKLREEKRKKDAEQAPQQ